MNDTVPAAPLVDAAAIAALHPALAPLDPELVADPRLPPDHPAWQRDVVSISSRARALLATLVPVVVRVVASWDHRVRELALGTRTLSVDPAGSYRLR